MKLASYNIGSIFEKGLFFLIPFFLFNREKFFAECETEGCAQSGSGESFYRNYRRTRYREDDDGVRDFASATRSA